MGEDGKSTTYSTTTNKMGAMSLGGGGPKTATDKYNEEAKEIYKNQSLDACPNCARTFNPESLAKHVKGC